MNTSTTGFDCIVIGAGIAGASVAAELASDRRMLLLERESQPGYHTTGRSAALFTVTYGPDVIRALSRASAAFFNDPASPHLDHPLLEPRGAVFVARQDQKSSLAHTVEELGPHVTPLTGAEIETLLPLLRKGYAAAGLRDGSAADIDVNGLHQHYLKSFRAAGGVLQTKAEVLSLRKDEDWQVDTSQGQFHAPIIVNAAGAWADEIATMAGLAPVDLTPKRRTALTVAPPEGMLPDRWPMVVDIDEQFYLKADAGKLLISPADATPSVPCDAQPEELDVAICIDRIETAFDISLRRIESRWAGLRSFVPDGDPVAGYDPKGEGFFWLAGQGGYGIQTAPALARAAAALVRGEDIPGDIAAEGVTAAALARDREGLA
ncbi:FAD-dependent catabolic D-arginine dehydrogenase DauA [Sulfitobacter sp. DSM 110093]|uniref:NAD(P)/FAD-dependent oxidoreductase n=1 Tax=Sulfitobacter sp. DSM 110093 TaxID=2883127 RepID=UPI001FAB90DD|nr:FAD-dependent oxidoreductase [Sulfitobacter sp. DSM 110093]UOA33547.1 FAD-dependent catabolic D-arginine dehydrogenase DauA [Sulfitobacter sp. DSM 110093]